MRDTSDGPGCFRRVLGDNDGRARYFAIHSRRGLNLRCQSAEVQIGFENILPGSPRVISHSNEEVSPRGLSSMSSPIADSVKAIVKMEMLKESVKAKVSLPQFTTALLKLLETLV